MKEMAMTPELMEENVTSDIPEKVRSADEIRQAEIEQELAANKSDTSGNCESDDSTTTPRGKIFLGQGGFGKVDEHSGTLSYNVPVFVPPTCHGGPTPDISLVYNSRSSDNHSFVAAGWRLMVGRIERNAPDDKTFPNFLNNQGTHKSTDSFRLELNGESHTLVRLYRKDERGQENKHIFVAKSEGAFIEAIRHIKDDAIDPDSGEAEIDYWTVQTADGHSYQFGIPGIAGEKQIAGQMRNKIWQLISITDPYGQRVEYEYKLSENKEFPNDIKFSCPIVVKSGMISDGSYWDSEIHFIYSKEGADPEFGFFEVKPEQSSGRKDATSCFVWDRLTEIQTYIRFDNSNKTLIRKLDIDSTKNEFNIFQANSINEHCYGEDGKPDEAAAMPPHRFIYTNAGATNPALAELVTEPLGRAIRLTYGNASLIDEGDKGATGLEDIQLVTSQTEIADKQEWQRNYRYFNGLMVGTREYRGHKQVHVHDLQTNHYIETHLEISGVHHGKVKKQITFARFNPETKRGEHKIREEENRWLALEYGAGRFRPFVQRSVKRVYAEDGQTIIASFVSEIPEASTNSVLSKPPWTYAVDQFGNVLEKIESSYAGHESERSLVLQTKTTTEYWNQMIANHRFVGLPTMIKKEATDNPSIQQLKLIELTLNKYDDHGKEIEKESYYTHEKAEKTIIEYDPQTGRELRTYRYNNGEQFLVQETAYYDKGPYRFLPRQIINAKGQIKRTLQYDRRFQEPIHIIDVDGMIGKMRYDGLGRALEDLYEGHINRSRDGAKDSVRHIYTVTQDELSIETIHVHTNASTKKYFDKLNREIKTIKTGYKGRLIVAEETEYDLRTRKPKRISEPHFEDEPSPGWSVMKYDDPQLRLTKTTHTNGRVERISYDGLRETKYQDIFECSEDGSVSKLLHTQVIEDKVADVAGREIRKAQGQPSQSTRYELTYKYDVASRKVSISDSMGVNLLTVDYGQRLDDKPIRTMDVSLGQTLTEYDDLGRVVKIIQGKGDECERICTNTYDELDRIVLQIEEDKESGDIRETRSQYDREPHGTGKIAVQEVREKSKLGTYTHCKKSFYDEFGYLSQEVQSWNVSWPDVGVDCSVETRTDLTYDGTKGGRLMRIKHPEIFGMGGSTVEYEYDDKSGLLTKVMLDNKVIWSVPEGQFTAREQARVAELGNGIKTCYEYEPKSGIITRITSQKGSTEIFDHLTRHDTAGNIRQRAISSACLDENGNEKQVTTESFYGYDDKNQLISVQEAGVEEQFEYCANGSRARYRNAQGETIYAYDESAPHQASKLSGLHERALRYDSLGNLLSDTNEKTMAKRMLEWSPANRLQQMHIIGPERRIIRQMCYGYGAENKRAIMYDTLEGRLVFYADNELEITWLGNEKDSVSVHIMNDERRIATYEWQRGSDKPRLHYYQRDHLQTVSLVYNDEGNVENSTNYDTFGLVSEQLGTYKPNIMFTGHRADVVGFHGFDHYDFGARLYDPAIGMFLSPDSEDDDINAAFGHNRYVYVNNNPLSQSDPTGHWSLPSWSSVKETLWNNPVTDLILNKTTSSFAAGAGDVVSLGITNKIRESTGLNSVVDKNSAAYTAGQVTGGVILVANVAAAAPTVIRAGAAAATRAAPVVANLATRTGVAMTTGAAAFSRMGNRMIHGGAQYVQNLGSRISAWWNQSAAMNPYWRQLTSYGRRMYAAGQRTFANAFYNKIPAQLKVDLKSPANQVVLNTLRGNWLKAHHPTRAAIGNPFKAIFSNIATGPSQEVWDIASRAWNFVMGKGG
ncbi:hypothetical protein KAU88_09645 [Candidatus Bathyarchaeota archaeon]|nr:hypothetical protein [Candidatus Bathyarchaeota archaeon]